MIEAGFPIASPGDFQAVNPIHFVPSMISVIAFYFTTAPIMKVLTGFDPLAPERLVERRAAVIDFISAALFTSRVSAPAQRMAGNLREKGERL